MPAQCANRVRVITQREPVHTPSLLCSALCRAKCCDGFLALLQQEYVLRGHTHEAHAALHPHLRHRDAAGLDAWHHAVRVAAFDYLVDGLDEQRAIELAGNSEGDGEGGRPDHDYVQAPEREQLV